MQMNFNLHNFGITLLFQMGQSLFLCGNAYFQKLFFFGRKAQLENVFNYVRRNFHFIFYFSKIIHSSDEEGKIQYLNIRSFIKRINLHFNARRVSMHFYYKLLNSCTYLSMSECCYACIQIFVHPRIA